ncbi:MAG: glycosyltransferase family 4 protein [Cyanobacteria bacterium P01_D01_bin.50]
MILSRRGKKTSENIFEQRKNKDVETQNKIPNHSFSSKIKNLSSARTEKLIKLSLITQFFPPDYAATGQLLEELARHLGYLGVDIEVFTGQPGYAFGTKKAPAREQSEQVRIQRTRATQVWYQRIRGKALGGVLFTLRAALHILRHARHHNVLLVTTAPPFLPVLGYLAHKLFKLTYVCILYDLYPDIAIALDVIPKHHWLARFWQMVNCKVWQEASQIIVLSPQMKQRVADICPRAADKISVIHSWGDAKKIVPIHKKDNWFAWEYNTVDKFTVLYSGNMGRCHDIDTILETAKLLKDEPIQFLCIGGGAKRKILVEEIKKLDLNNFQFIAYQEKCNLPYSLTACDLSLVSMDKGFESLVAPSKLYPALATGRPVAVICPQDSYLKQLIAEGKCGQTFDNGDSQGLAKFIRLLSKNRQLAESMGKAARKYMQLHFTPEVIANEYLKVLRKVVE